MHPPISDTMDAVITWVDGHDANHRVARLRHRGEAATLATSNAVAETRFMQAGEIYYCIASILKFAPFIRRIHVVTDNQRPPGWESFAAAGLCRQDQIQIVDHREVFRGLHHWLPTFNSLSIESVLWRIPGLAEYFLYFNDDFILNAPLTFRDLVTPTGELRLHGRERSVAPRLWQWRWKRLRARILGRGMAEPTFQFAQMLAAHRLGQRTYLHLPHVPYLFRRETLARYFDAHPSELVQQIRHRFRSPEQYLPASLANQLELRSGRAIFSTDDPCVYIEPPAPKRGGTSSWEAELTQSKRYVCIQSLDQFANAEQEQVHRWLRSRLESHLPPDLEPSRIVRTSQAS